jgi:hypothetical protein
VFGCWPEIDEEQASPPPGGERTAAAHQVPETDPALVVQGDDLTIQDHLSPAELVAHLIGQVLKSAHGVTAPRLEYSVQLLRVR